jgi:radical SAM superfamily enzyme YgiQ (UPF0313 family)
MFDGAKLKVLSVRLSSYSAVSLSMSHSLVAQIFRHSRPEGEVFIDHAYLPARKDLELLADNGVPPLFGRASKADPMDFDILAITNAIVMEQTNLPRLLGDSNIPLFSTQRTDWDTPLVMIGGANASTCDLIGGKVKLPDGSVEQSFFDIAFLGEAEATLAKFVTFYLEAREKGMSRPDFYKAVLDASDEMPGFYIPTLYDHVYEDLPEKPEKESGEGGYVLKSFEKKYDKAPDVITAGKMVDLNDHPILKEGVIFFDTPMSGCIDAAIALGCTGGASNTCSFCRESIELAPYRERNNETLRPQIREAVSLQGADEVNYFALNFNQHSEIWDVVKGSLEDVGRVNLISQRTDILAADPGQAKIQRWLGKRNFTIGVEGCSERLRNYFNKNLTERQLLTGLEHLFKAGAVEIKLFYIISGIETEEDIAEFSEFIDKALALRDKIVLERAAGDSNNRGKSIDQLSKPKLRCSWTPIYTSAHTMLSFAECYSVTGIGQDSLRAVVEKTRETSVGFRTSSKRSEIIISQLLTIGNRSCTQLIYDASVGDSFLYYGLVPKGQDQIWVERARQYGMDLNYFWLEKDLSHIFPWDMFNYFTDKVKTYEAYLDRKQFLWTSYCLRTVANDSPMCDACNACFTKEHRKNILTHGIQKSNDILQLDEDIFDMSQVEERMSHFARNIKGVCQARWKIVISDPFLKYVGKNYFGRALARAFMLADEGNTQLFLRMSDQNRSHLGSVYRDWVIGEGIYTMQLSEVVSSERLQAMLPAINSYLQPAGWKVEGVKASINFQSAKRVGGVIYEVKVPINLSARLSLLGINKAVDTYYNSKNLKIKKKVATGKGVFKVEEQDFDKADVFGIAIKFEGRQGFSLRIFAKNNLPVFSMLETIFKWRFQQSKSVEIDVLGYYDVPQATKRVSLLDIVSGTVNENPCSECGNNIEKDSFFDEPYKSNSGPNLCILHDMG